MPAVMNRSLTIKPSQCRVHRYMNPLLDRIRRRDRLARLLNGANADPADPADHPMGRPRRLMGVGVRPVDNCSARESGVRPRS